MLRVADELKTFAKSVSASGFEHVMVCGMGGSSLCPEVLRQTFGRQEGFPELLVLDSTDPDTINNFKERIDTARCLFVIASKSGTTTEPIAFHRFWYNEVAQHSDATGFLCDDHGPWFANGRPPQLVNASANLSPPAGHRRTYSALFIFRMVPATLMGVDARGCSDKRIRLVVSLRSAAAANQNPAAMLARVYGECAHAGRDKLTIVTDQKLAALGLWVEQLIAESTGKEGKGIVPVVDEPLGTVSDYGNDRLFVSISVGPADDETSSRLKALEAAGHPVVYRHLADVYDLGAEFFLCNCHRLCRLALDKSFLTTQTFRIRRTPPKALLEKSSRWKIASPPLQRTVHSRSTARVGDLLPSLSVREATSTCAKIKPATLALCHTLKKLRIESAIDNSLQLGSRLVAQLRFQGRVSVFYWHY